MANELDGILNSNVQSVTGGYFEPIYQGEESFLQNIVTPIYKVLVKVFVSASHKLSVYYVIIHLNLPNCLFFVTTYTIMRCLLCSNVAGSPKEQTR